MTLSMIVRVLTLALFASPVLADGQPLKQPGRWVQDYIAREADPAILFGTLPNGLRYAIMHNETPRDGVSMRMRIGAGSILERDEEQGLAHFLEHMAFRGSENIADGDVVAMLERQGLRFGADTNASTEHDQTVYMFTFPKADATALDTGFTLFREIGERLTLAPAAVEAEKGVILSEERVRDVPGYRSARANLGNALAGTRAVSRWPIGLVETIKGATPERLRRYYSANYRPDNATLIVVGNVDPPRVEAQIKARFSDWTSGPREASADPGTPSPMHPAVEFVSDGTQDTMTLSWVRPIDPRAETDAVDREQLLQNVGLTVLNNRLADRAARPGSPYVMGRAGSTQSLLGSAAMTQLSIVGAPGKWQEALASVVEEQRHVLEHGVTPAELKRAATKIITEFQSSAADASTRSNNEIADSLVKAVNEDQLQTSPAQDLALVEAILASAEPKDVDAALQLAFAGKGPVLFRATQSGPVSTPALQEALSQAYAKTLSSRDADVDVTWPYTDFGPPSDIVSQSEDAAMGTTTVTFANGARLIVKPTAFEKDTVHVSVALGSGRKGTDPALVRALWAAQLMPFGGTGKLGFGDIGRWAQVNGIVVNARMAARNGSFQLTGKTRPQDLGRQMQLLAAFVRDPGFRPELADRMIAFAPMMAGQVEANAGAVFMREMQRVTSGGESRYGQVPSRSDMSDTRPDDLRVLLGPALSGPADVTIVGDVTVPDAIRHMQETFGAGAVAARVASPAVRIAPPAGRSEPYFVTHGGRADQAYYGEFWALPDYFADPRTSYAADVTAAILQARLIETVREKLGLTYSPQVDAVSSVELQGYGYFGAMIETPPANFATFHDLVTGLIVELSARPVSADALERAKKPLIESWTKEFEDNDYWLSRLPLTLRDPRVKAPTLDQAAGIRAVTAADVQDVLKLFIAGRTPITVIAKAR